MRRMILIAALAALLPRPERIDGQVVQRVEITSGPQPAAVADAVLTEYDVLAQLHGGWNMRGTKSARGKTNLNDGANWLIWELAGAADVLSDPKEFKKVKGAKHKVNLKQDVYDTRIKETYVLEQGADTTLVFTINTSFSPELRQDGSIQFGGMLMTAPWAIDAQGDSVRVEVAFAGPVAGLYTLTWTVRAGNAVWPVTVDPSVTINSSAGIGGTLSFDDATYLTARNSEIAETIITSYHRVGVEFGGGVHGVGRGFFAFDLSSVPVGATIDSAWLVLTEQNMGADIDTLFITRSSYAKSTITTSDFNRFDGWAASGTYGGVMLLDTIKAANMVPAQKDTFRFTAAGVDTITAHVSDSLKIAILSLQDVIVQATAGYPLLGFYAGDDSGSEPRLIVFYPQAPAPSGPAITRSLGLPLYEHNPVILRNAGRPVNQVLKQP